MRWQTGSPPLGRPAMSDFRRDFLRAPIEQRGALMALIAVMLAAPFIACLGQ